jgi:hypothetical protein
MPREIRVVLVEERERGRSGRLAKALNAPFTIWFLSSVIVAAIGFAVTQRQEWERARQAETARLEKLAVELTYRLRSQPGDASRAEFADLVARLEGRKGDRDVGALPEFRGIPVEPLYDEYCRRVTPTCTVPTSDIAFAAWRLGRALEENSRAGVMRESGDLQVIQNAALAISATRNGLRMFVRQLTREEAPGGGWEASTTPLDERTKERELRSGSVPPQK